MSTCPHSFRLMFSQDYSANFHKACRNTWFDLCSAWINCIGPTCAWCWVVIKAVDCTRCILRHNHSVWCCVDLFCNASRKNRQIYTQQQTCRFVLMLILLELIAIFWTHEVHYKVLQRKLQKISTMVVSCMVFCLSGLLSVHQAVGLYFRRHAFETNRLTHTAELTACLPPIMQLRLH